jgi:mannose-1-phosphate guanylyltransferase
MKLLDLIRNLFKRKRYITQDRSKYASLDNTDVVLTDDNHSEIILSPLESIEHELELLGIPDDHLSYKAIVGMTNINKNYNEYDQILNVLASDLGITNKGILSNSLRMMIETAKFNRSSVDELRTISNEAYYKNAILKIYKWVVSLQ